MIGIYKITNLLNKQSYIGQSICVESRIKQHILSSEKEYAREYDSPIHKSIRKNGLNNFKFELLEECPKEKLNEREIYWINYYNSYLNGYNQTIGGCAFEDSKIPVCGFDILTGEQKYFYNSIAEAEHNHKRGVLESVTNPILSRKVDDLCWFALKDIEDKNKEEIKKMVFQRYPLVVCQLDLEGNLLNKFMSSKEANMFVKGNSFGNITLCCENKRNKAHGYQWCYYKDLESRINKQVKKPIKRNKPVYQYSKDWNFIKKWNSLTQASQELNIDISNISVACNNNNRNTGGFKWSFELKGECE